MPRHAISSLLKRHHRVSSCGRTSCLLTRHRCLDGALRRGRLGQSLTLAITPDQDLWIQLVKRTSESRYLGKFLFHCRLVLVVLPVYRPFRKSTPRI